MSDNKSAPEPSMDEILASIRRILAEDESAPPPPQRARAAIDILDLTEAIDDDGTVRHIAPISPAPPETPAPMVSGDRVEPTAPRLVSDAASEAIAASFARLGSVARRDGGDAMLEEVVRDALRPLLQAWLDENLPALVERLVRAEIARVVGARPLAP